MQESYYQPYFDAEMKHWWFSARRKIISALLRQHAPSSRPLAIGDVGCGMGASVEMLGEFGNVVGSDFSSTALAFSREHGNTRLAAAALPHLPFRDAAFDIVTAFDVIEHVDDDHAAARDLWRICKPGGLLVVTVPAYQWLWSEHDDINEHRRRYTMSRLRQCLDQPGVSFLTLSYMNTLLAPPVMLYRLLHNALGQRKSTDAPRSDVFALPSPVNGLLERIFSLEAMLVRHVRQPFGISVICVARKAP